jgi:NAD(P)-dependent dehydrogenase (short-subunit alcohol dehydrogenase family)
MSGRLEGKIALVTGAASGIGRTCAVRFAAEGATVVGVDLNEAGLDDTTRLVHDAAAFVPLVGNLTAESAVEAVFATVDERFGRLDVLHNCVGGSTGRDSAVEHLDAGILDEVIALELRTAILGSKFGVPLLRRAGGGAVVNMTSYVAFRGVSQIHAYSAAKGAIVSLTRAMAGTYARERIRVNAIAPGIALTERARARIQDPNVTSTLPFDWADYPFAMGQPEDIANVALFLASDESRMITGATIMADGGLTSY